MSDSLYETQKLGVGFAFASIVGRRTIELMQASSLDDDVWNIISEVAENAQAYCLDPDNRCISRYEAAPDEPSEIAP
jgi:hypothetical protein